MNIKIKLPKCKIRYTLFIAYNLFYVLYMMGYTSQTLYLFTMVVFCGMNASIFLKKTNNKRRIFCINDLKNGLNYVTVFLVISLCIQAYHMDFGTYLFSGVIRIFLPIINAFLLINTTNDSERKYFFNVLLARYVIHFFWSNYQNLTLSNILSISWINSESEMESSLAHDFLIMEMYYLYKKDIKKAILSMVLCMLSLKRLSFILAPFLLIISRFIPTDKRVKNSYCIALKFVAIISPFIILLLYSEPVVKYIYDAFHVNLNLIMSGRPAIFYNLQNNIPYYNGYGSINDFLGNFVFSHYGTTWNGVLHNDFLRVYLETGIIGVAVLANSLVELSKHEYWTFFMIVYLIFVAITSHILSYFSVWILFYMIVMDISRVNEERIN